MADQFQQLSIFETVLLRNQFGEVGAINESLKKSILEREQVDKGTTRSNARLTWHSNFDMAEWAGQAYKDLESMFMEQFTLQARVYGAIPGSELKMRLQLWAMVQRTGDYATPHTHPNAHFSGCYYVATGGEGKYKESGNIEFFDTRGGPGALTVPGLGFNQRHMYRPNPGLMITFPGWIPHMVHPSAGTGERIAIAANATIIKYKPKEA